MIVQCVMRSQMRGSPALPTTTSIGRGNSEWSVIMSEVLFSQGADEGTIRKLWPTETDKFRDHLLRLDKMSRRLRFAHGVSDSFIEDYAGRTTEMGALVYAYFEGGQVRAAAELKKLGDVWGQEAEAAVAV